MKSEKKMAILGVHPLSGVPGGEVLIECRGFKPESYSKVFLGEVEASIASASDDKSHSPAAGQPEEPWLDASGRRGRVGRFPF